MKYLKNYKTFESTMKLETPLWYVKYKNGKELKKLCEILSKNEYHFYIKRDSLDPLEWFNNGKNVEHYVNGGYIFNSDETDNPEKEKQIFITETNDEDNALGENRIEYPLEYLNDCFEGEGFGFFGLKDGLVIENIDNEKEIEKTIFNFIDIYAKDNELLVDIDMKNDYRIISIGKSDNKYKNTDEKYICWVKTDSPMMPFKYFISEFKQSGKIKIYNYLKEKYPEYFEADNMGFFDLKTNEDIISNEKSIYVQNIIDFFNKHAEINNHHQYKDILTIDLKKKVINTPVLGTNKPIELLNISSNYKGNYPSLFLEYCFVKEGRKRNNIVYLLSYDVDLIKKIWETITELYPDLVEADGMGFFDLKNENNKYIKTYKLFENTENYGETFDFEEFDIFAQEYCKNMEYRGWKFTIQYPDSYEWYNNEIDYTILTTIFYDANEYVPISILNNDGREIFLTTERINECEDLKFPKNENEKIQLMKWYTEDFMPKIIESVEQRDYNIKLLSGIINSYGTQKNEEKILKIEKPFNIEINGEKYDFLYYIFLDISGEVCFNFIGDNDGLEDFEISNVNINKISNFIKADYPEFEEGSKMGFFDLKTK